MGRLIVVSNRLPITVRVEHGVPVLGSSSGGLVSGLIRHHECNDTLWVGYPGERSGVEPERLAELDAELGKRRIVPVWIESDTYRRFYDGFANGVIWPVFHYLTGKLPLWTSKMRAYEAANQQFADAIAAVYRPGDLVWIHD